MYHHVSKDTFCHFCLLPGHPLLPLVPQPGPLPRPGLVESVQKAAHGGPQVNCGELTPKFSLEHPFLLGPVPRGQAGGPLQLGHSAGGHDVQ